ncbi:MAG: heme-binding domain-containing protein [Caldilineaceae bacterium]
MRQKLIWAVVIVFILLIAIQFIPVNRTNPPVTQEVKWNSPETKALAQRACFDCHSNETTWPWDSYIAPVSWYIANHIDEGRRRLNFSAWDQPNSSLEEVVRSIKNDSMPLQSYLIMHPNAKLTQSEKDALIAGLTATMQQDPPVPGRRERRE